MYSIFEELFGDNSISGLFEIIRESASRGE